MNPTTHTIPRLAFVDFMYAIVVGATFPLIAPLELSFRFFGMLFLVLVVLEDFYLYHTQILRPDQPSQGGFLALVMEISILLAWYLSAISFPKNPFAFLVAFGAFYLLKLLAGAAHFTAARQLRSWRFYRSLSFLVPLAAAVYLSVVGVDGRLSSPAVYGVVVAAWLIQVSGWWTITRRRERVEASSA